MLWGKWKGGVCVCVVGVGQKVCWAQATDSQRYCKSIQLSISPLPIITVAYFQHTSISPSWWKEGGRGSEGVAQWEAVGGGCVGLGLGGDEPGVQFLWSTYFVQNEKIKTIPIFGEKNTFTFLEGIFKCGSNANFYSEYVCKVQKKLSKYCLSVN